jgi:competence protein ComEC
MLQSAALLLAMASLGGVRSAAVRQSHDRVAWPDGFVRYEAVVVSEVTEKPKTMAADIVTAQGGKKLKCYVAKDDRSRRLRIGDRLLLTSRIEQNGDWRRG